MKRTMLKFPADENMIDALKHMRDLHRKATKAVDRETDALVEIPLAAYFAAAATLGISLIGVSTANHGTREAARMLDRAFLDLGIFEPHKEGDGEE